MLELGWGVVASMGWKPWCDWEIKNSQSGYKWCGRSKLMRGCLHLNWGDSSAIFVDDKFQLMKISMHHQGRMQQRKKREREAKYQGVKRSRNWEVHMYIDVPKKGDWQWSRDRLLAMSQPWKWSGWETQVPIQNSKKAIGEDAVTW